MRRTTGKSHITHAVQQPGNLVLKLSDNEVDVFRWHDECSTVNSYLFESTRRTDTW